VPAVETDRLTKRFGHTVALDALDLTIEMGDVFGYLGPNGAGKSTTIALLLGLIRTTSGSARTFGLDVWRDALIQRFDLAPDKKIRAYSHGNKQKVLLIAALASRTDLQLLDEPTTGLDPLMEQVFRAFVREAHDRGQTVLLSSHILSEVEADRPPRAGHRRLRARNRAARRGTRGLHGRDRITAREHLDGAVVEHQLARPRVAVPLHGARARRAHRPGNCCRDARRGGRAVRRRPGDVRSPRPCARVTTSSR
jgi:ABC-type transport system involved in cytochrome c biogenesis ATPase subunit